MFGNNGLNINFLPNKLEYFIRLILYIFRQAIFAILYLKNCNLCLSVY